MLAAVGPEPAVVVATPGAEPVAEGGYAAVVLLDTWLLLWRVDLRAEEEAVRRWSDAVGLVRPGGRALLVGDPGHPALQALVRWDHAGLRRARGPRAARGPPAPGQPAGHDHRLARRRRRRRDAARSAPPGTEVLGPVPVE